MKNRLVQLLRDNVKAKARMPLNVILTPPKAEGSAPEATIYVYDVIVSDTYWGGVGSEDFAKALVEAALVADTIHLRINSPGGDVFAARAMEATVRGCQKKVVAHVDGYAASAASYLALACDEVEIAQGGFFMIHKAWCFVAGNADDMLSNAAWLNKIDASLVETYASETGLDAKKIEAMMAAETWITSQEAVDMGFADRIAEDAPKAQAKAWNLAAYQNAPQAEQKDTEPESATPSEAPQAPSQAEEAPPAPAESPEGDAGPCTSDEGVGLNHTGSYDEAYFDKLNRQLALRERLGR